MYITLVGHCSFQHAVTTAVFSIRHIFLWSLLYNNMLLPKICAEVCVTFFIFMYELHPPDQNFAVSTGTLWALVRVCLHV